MNSAKTGRIIRIVVTVLLILLILVSLTGIVLFGTGVRNTKQTGTFNLLEPDLEKNDLVVVRHLSFSQLKEGDLMAFYMEEDGKEYLLIRRIQSIRGITYTVEDNSGEGFEVSADTCRILGKATSKSTTLGKAVLFLQTSEGRTIFYGWTAGVTAFLLGLTILVHVLGKLLFGKPVESDGPVDALTGQPLSFDEPITIETGTKRR